MEKLRAFARFSQRGALRKNDPSILRHTFDHLYIQAFAYIVFKAEITISFMFLTRQVDQVRKWDKPGEFVILDKQSSAVMTHHFHDNDAIRGIDFLDQYPIGLNRWNRGHRFRTCHRDRFEFEGSLRRTRLGVLALLG